MMEISSRLSKEFEAEYSGAMTDFLRKGGEIALHRAYELGRRAVDEGQTLLDLTHFHNEVLLQALTRFPEGERNKMLAEGAIFFAEFLSPFEMTYRGFMEAVAALKTEIAERQHAEEALAQSEKYYKSLIENALDIVTILDASGNIIYTTPSGERVLGYSLPEFAGRNVFEFVHPDDVDYLLDIFTAGRSTPLASAKAEFRFRHKNGDWLIMESIGKNLLDDPFVKGIIVNSRDITERRNLEDIRRKYEFIVNASKEFMMLLNIRNEFEAVNEACCVALDRNREDIIGKAMDSVLGYDLFQSLVGPQLNECFAGSETKHEGWYELPGIGRKFLEIDCYPYRNNLSAVTHAIIIMRNATGRKENEDKIRESQRRRAEDMRMYARMTQRAQEDERRRISMELHDDICQRLTALNIRMNVFEDSVTKEKKIGLRTIRSVRKEINSLIDEVRLISHNLRPSAIDHFGLATALRVLCSEYKKLKKMTIGFETNIEPHTRYHPEIEIALYRVAQEALSNCVKHANAKEARLSLSESNGMLVMTVTDRGKGFDSSEYRKLVATEKHFGLMNMQERIELCGGSFQIESSAESGTTVKAIVALEKQNEN